MKKHFLKLSVLLLLITMIITGCKVQSVEEFNKIEDDEIEDIKETAREESDKLDKEEAEEEEEEMEEAEEAKKEKSEKDDSEKDNSEEKDELKEDTKEEKEDELDKVEEKDKKEVEEVEVNIASQEDKESNNKKTDQGSQQKTETKADTKEKDQPKAAEDKKPGKPVQEEKPGEKPVDKPADKPKVEADKPAEVKKKYVTIEIRVDTILDNYDKLDPNLQSEKFVPSSGIILKKTKLELNEGENVFDILLKATRENRIHMEYQGASENKHGSAYIQGINNVYEFSVGELSGWMYNVNGIYPNYGVSNYNLEDGDNISFNYTCDLGRDLGQKWVK